MYQVEDDPQAQDQPIETIHLYVVREGQTRPSIVSFSLSVFLLALFIFLTVIALPVLILAQQPQEPTTIRVPAILLPLQTFTTSVSVIPTGTKTYPATTAHGTLTITNGSILSEELPKGMILTGKDGIEVVTDQAVFVPAGNATSLGYATVTAHAAVAGAAGNIQSLDINAVEGTSLYIRNLAAFRGGADSYSVKFITSQDRANVLTQARAILLPQTLNGLLDSPCKETITGDQRPSVSWTCQFVSYSIPDLLGVKVLHAEVRGKTILLEIVFVARPRILTVK